MAPGILLDSNDHLIPTKAATTAYTTPGAKPTRHGAPWNALLYRSVRSTPLTLAGASGSWLKVYDNIKSWYIFDGSGGAAVSNIGYGDSRPRQAEKDHFDRTGLTYAPASSFRTEIGDEFADYLCGSTGYQLVKALFFSSGMDLVVLRSCSPNTVRF
jgi:adenosylmethionine-8-amino-7-oxononanoate aminotransferase